MTAEVTTPFRLFLAQGESSFIIHVPKHHLTNDRKFYFSQIKVAPDFFSREASKLNFDADPEMDKNIDFPVQIKLMIDQPNDLYGPKYVNSKLTSTTLDAIERINDHFESNKPDFFTTTPFFIDFTDIMLDKSNDPKQYVPVVTQTYYKDYYSSAIYSDKLPPSVRDIDGVNNYLLPIDFMGDIAFNMRIRLRIWMAPYTRAIFSSNEPFVSELGFTVDQFGASIKNQYHLVNNTEHWLPMIIGTSAPKKHITKLDFKITLASSSDYIASPVQISRMKKRDWIKDEKVAKYLSELIGHFSRQCNIQFSFGYRQATHQFYFILPLSDNLSVGVSVLPEFAMRLGFGETNLILKGMQGMPIQQVEDNIQQATANALAVVYDTGPIVCTLDQVSSNTTSGAMDQIMAVLYPHESGILEMPESLCSCKANAVHIPVLTQSNSALVPVTFRLLRIYDDQKISNFMWSHGAYVFGSLQGFCSDKV